MLLSRGRLGFCAIRPDRFLRAIFNRVLEMRRAVQGRRAIAAMDARMLADIGLSQAEAAEEANRKPWDTAPR